MKLLFVPIAAMVLMLAGCEVPNSAQDAEHTAMAEAIKVKAQAEAEFMRKNANATAAMEKHLEQVQDDVVKACIAHSGVPVILQGQVMCGKGPK